MSFPGMETWNPKAVGITGSTGIAGATGPAGSAGSGDTFAYPDPDKTPSSPSVYDDEFNVSPIDSKWTTVNWSSATIADVNTTVPSALYLQTPTLNSVLVSALQPIPAGDFTIVTKIAVSNKANVSGPGLILSNSATTASGAQVLHHTGVNGGSGSYVETYAWATFSAIGASVLGTIYNRDIKYLRIRRISSSYYFGWSEDGKLWTDSIGTIAITPTHFGIATNSASNQLDSAFDFFRYYNSGTAINWQTRNIGNGAVGMTGATGPSGGVTGPTGATGAPPKLRVSLAPPSAELNGVSTEPLFQASVGTNFNWTELQYADAVTNTAQWIIPKSSTDTYSGGTLSLDIMWLCTTNTNNVVWQIQMGARGDAALFDAALASVRTISASSAPGTVGNIKQTTLSFTPTSSELLAGSISIFKLTRLGTDGADTCTGIARVIAVSLTEA